MITRSAAATASPHVAPRLDSDSVRRTTRSSGANLAASVYQLDTTLVGATTRNGGCSGDASRAWQISASAWRVLPRPMSSARIPPS